MNVNTEPVSLLVDYCKAKQADDSLHIKGLYFDDETDVQPFLDWVLFNNADGWSYLKEYHETDDLGLIRLGLDEGFRAA